MAIAEAKGNPPSCKPHAVTSGAAFLLKNPGAGLRIAHQERHQPLALPLPPREHQDQQSGRRQRCHQPNNELSSRAQR